MTQHSVTLIAVHVERWCRYLLYSSSRTNVDHYCNDCLSSFPSVSPSSLCSDFIRFLIRYRRPSLLPGLCWMLFFARTACFFHISFSSLVTFADARCRWAFFSVSYALRPGLSPFVNFWFVLALCFADYSPLLLYIFFWNKPLFALLLSIGTFKLEKRSNCEKMRCCLLASLPGFEFH